MSTGSDGSATARRWLRLALVALALEMFALGVPASVAPGWFYRWFPLGRGWVSATGAYNEHSMLDFGYVSVALGVVLVWAAVRLGRELCRAAAVATVVANVPHLLFHAGHTRELPTGDNLAQDSLLALSVVIGVGALLLTVYRPSATTPDRLPAGRQADGA